MGIPRRVGHKCSRRDQALMEAIRHDAAMNTQKWLRYLRRAPGGAKISAGTFFIRRPVVSHPHPPAYVWSSSPPRILVDRPAARVAVTDDGENGCSGNAVADR